VIGSEDSVWFEILRIDQAGIGYKDCAYFWIGIQKISGCFAGIVFLPTVQARRMMGLGGVCWASRTQRVCFDYSHLQWYR
jgi:hypothetical protein